MKPVTFDREMQQIIMQSPTIRDVAKHAQVSVATVSRVLNNSARVREHTRQRVLTAIEELGFSPNSAARQLSGGKTYTIAVFSPLFTRPAFVERLAGIQHTLESSDFELVLFSVRSINQLNQQLSTLARQNRFDGLIMLSVSFEESLIFEANPDLPVIVIDDERASCYPSVVIDNVQGGQIATEHLINQGHRDIGFIGDEQDRVFGFNSSQRRFKGFQQALEANQLESNPIWNAFGPHARHVAHEQAKHILSLSHRPTAIVTASDTQAFGVLMAAEELGIRVPDDVAVIGFDNIEPAEYMNLTTVHARMFESGQLGAQILLDWVAAGEFGQDEWQTKLPLKIIVRKTA